LPIREALGPRPEHPRILSTIESSLRDRKRITFRGVNSLEIVYIRTGLIREILKADPRRFLSAFHLAPDEPPLFRLRIDME